MPESIVSESQGHRQKRYRTKVAVWACAYEYYNESFVHDTVFDTTCRLVNPMIPTDKPELDKWFRKYFDHSTGMWVRKHPELNRLRAICESIIKYHRKSLLHDVQSGTKPI